MGVSVVISVVVGSNGGNDHAKVDAVEPLSIKIWFFYKFT